MPDTSTILTTGFPLFLNSIKDVGDVPPNRIYLKATDKQEELIKIVLSGKYNRMLYGGAVGGAKTFGWIVVLSILCRIYPGSRWVVIRKDRKVLERNTIPSFWKAAPRPFFAPDRFNKTKLEAVATNTSMIIFMGENRDKDKELTAFDGLEVNGAIMEEAHEMSEALYFRLVDRIGRWDLSPEPSPLPFIGMSCNPNQGWLKKEFYTPWQNGSLPAEYAFIPALPTDNPHLPDTYIQGLEELKRRAPNLYRKRVQGSWEAEDDVQQLIKWETLHASERLLQFSEDAKKDLIRSLGVDVGRHGPDKSVWMVFEGTHEEGFNRIYVESYDTTDGPQVEQKTKEIINKFEIPHHRTWMDTVGLGGPCYDHLCKDGYMIQSFVGGARPLEQYLWNEKKTNLQYFFNNLNSQAGWAVKVLAEDGKLGGIDYDTLKEDLAAYRYDIRGEKTIWIWPKDKIKEEIHRSPDDGDACKYGIWGAMYDTLSPLPGIASV